MSRCEENCGREAEVYAMDPMPAGWGGRYCRECAEQRGYQVTDRFGFDAHLHAELHKHIRRRRERRGDG